MRTWFACVLLLLLPASAFAQAPEPPPAREGTAEFAFVSTTGNASTQTLGLSGEVIFRPDTWVVRNRTVFVRSESEDILAAESFLNLFRTEKALSSRLSAFGEYSYFRDEFAGVDHRNTLIAGPAYKLVNLPDHVLVVDAGFGYLNEQRLVGDDVSSGTYGFGSGYKWRISPTAEFSDDLRYTGTFAEAEDWRLANVASLTTQITTIFSLKLSNIVRYVNLPVEGFKDTDTTTSVALVAKF
jgi:putative salt-induced outer membrane protein YdiY